MSAIHATRIATAARTGWRLFRLCAAWCSRVNRFADHVSALAEGASGRK